MCYLPMRPLQCSQTNHTLQRPYPHTLQWHRRSENDPGLDLHGEHIGIGDVLVTRKQPRQPRSRRSGSSTTVRPSQHAAELSRRPVRASPTPSISLSSRPLSSQSFPVAFSPPPRASRSCSCHTLQALFGHPESPLANRRGDHGSAWCGGTLLRSSCSSRGR